MYPPLLTRFPVDSVPCPNPIALFLVLRQSGNVHRSDVVCRPHLVVDRVNLVFDQGLGVSVLLTKVTILHAATAAAGTSCIGTLSCAARR